MFSSAVFYQRLSDLCRKRHTCVTLFARDVLHTSTSAPTNWKNGTVPSAEIVHRCASALEVSADYLLGLSDTPERMHTPLTQQETSLIQLLRQSDSRSREIALASMLAVLTACQDSPAQADA